MNASVLGSFDPITNGHIDIIKRALSMFDKVFVAIGFNIEKKSLYSVCSRKLFIEHALEHSLSSKEMARVVITHFTGSAVDFMLRNNVTVNIRGIRNSVDYEYERSMAQINKNIATIDTAFIPCNPLYNSISSSNVKAMVKSGLDVSAYVPMEVKANLEANLLGLIYVGVVGRSGSGKSVFIRDKIECHPKYVIDCDKIVRNIWKLDEYALIRKLILSKFASNGIMVEIETQNAVDKIKMRNYLVDSTKNEIIRDIMKPYINSCIREYIQYISAYPIFYKNVQITKFFDEQSDVLTLVDSYPTAKVVAIDAPMLFEYDMIGLVNNTIINQCTEFDVCKKRIISRDKLTNDEANARLMIQLTPEQLKEKWNYFNKKDSFGSYAEYK